MDDLLKRRMTEGAHLPSRPPTPPPRGMTPDEQGAHSRLGAKTSALEAELMLLPANPERDRAIGVLENIQYWAYKSRIAEGS